MTFLELYLLSRLDGLQVLFRVGAVVSVAIFVVCCFIVFCKWLDAYREAEEAKIKKVVRNGLPKLAILLGIPMLICVLGSVATPSFKEALTFLGVDYATHNERIGNNVDKTMQVFENFIDAKLKQVKEEGE